MQDWEQATNVAQRSFKTARYSNLSTDEDRLDRNTIFGSAREVTRGRRPECLGQMLRSYRFS